MASRKVILSKIMVAVFIIALMMPVIGVAFAKSDKSQEQSNNIEQTQKSQTKNPKQEILVKYKNSDKSKRGQVKETISKKLKNKKLKSSKELKNSNIEVFELFENEDVESVISELEKDANVEYAQPNYELQIFNVSQENISVIDQVYNSNNSNENITGIDINILKAWEITKGSSDVIVGVLDTGLDIRHPDIANNIYYNTKEIPRNGIDDDGNGYIDDYIGWDFANNDNNVYDSENETHATHISGIIAAEENGQGIVGIAPKVRILPLKFINGNTGYTSCAIEAINYAEEIGIKIINCSWGSPYYNPALKDAMENSDITFVASSGNNGINVMEQPIYPACFDIANVISVGAVNNDGTLAIFSNYGDEVHVAAPGVSVLSTVPENQYAALSGTSISTAYVSGVASLIKSAYPDMDSNNLAKTIRYNVSTNTALEDKILSKGIVDA